MAKRKTLVSTEEVTVAVATPDPIPTEDKPKAAVCPNCKYVMQHKTQIVCHIPLPPHFSTTGRVPYVHDAFTCGLFKQG